MTLKEKLLDIYGLRLYKGISDYVGKEAYKWVEDSRIKYALYLEARVGEYSIIEIKYPNGMWIELLRA